MTTDRKKGAARERYQPLPAGAVGTRPIVAIVGRPNVGKSTLFNRLAGRRIAIVEDIAGVTRDRHYADTNVLGRECVVIDTGGFDPESEDPMAASIANQVKLALSECDVVLCVLDASREATEADREAVKLLRMTKKPVIYVANKSDSPKRANEAMELYELGIPALIPISGLHGHGVGDLEEALLAVLPDREIEGVPALGGVPRVAIIGRPNAGKSSLVNQLLKEERQIVDNRPGTTVDSVDALLTRGDKSLVLIDTAGIRRKASVHEAVEGLSVFQAIRAMERSEAAVLMIDGNAGVSEQDAKIAGLAEDRGRALVIGLNKCDLLSREQIQAVETKIRDVLAFVPWAPIVHMSSLTGRGVEKLVTTVEAAVEAHQKRITTGELNRFFAEAIQTHPPPIHRGKPVRLYYITQAQTSPPAFICVANYPEAVHFSYKRYVINQIRSTFGFEATPVRVMYRGKNKKQEDDE